MRRSLILVPLLMMAACGEEARDILDPLAANSVSPGTNAIVTVDGTQYRIGCPDFPCPVTPLVLDHIASRQYFWLPPGTLAKPAIYLYVLRTPVQLSSVATTPAVLPPSVLPPAPSLAGPPIMKGMPFGGMAQLVCGSIPFTFNVPDNLPWDFVSGEVRFEYVAWNASLGQWVPTGHQSLVPLLQNDWNAMLAGNYSVIPPVGTLEYYATFTIDLSRGAVAATVSHTLLCSRQGPPPAAPPAPSLDGPTEYTGTRPSPSIGNLVCSGIDLDLISPDAGPWDFVSGERFLEFMHFRPPLQAFELNGTTRTDPLSASDWDSLLDGSYVIDLQSASGPYFLTFTVVVERGQYEHTISHRAVCGGNDFYNFPHPN